jgi:hypothetical protein
MPCSGLDLRVLRPVDFSFFLVVMIRTTSAARKYHYATRETSDLGGKLCHVG